jgi:hypothetical protein
MSFQISVSPQQIEQLDLTPAIALLQPWQTSDWVNHLQSVQFDLEYPQPADTEEPLELSEIAEVRLWFIRLDTVYPWLPYCLDWRSGDLVRYTAMLVPHQFSEREGIQFNPQALDLFIMQKVFVIHQALAKLGLERNQTLKQMAEMFGYELSDQLFDLLK